MILDLFVEHTGRSSDPPNLVRPKKGKILKPLDPKDSWKNWGLNQAQISYPDYGL